LCCFWGFWILLLTSVTLTLLLLLVGVGSPQTISSRGLSKKVVIAINAGGGAHRYVNVKW
jgi:hypothetical protein